MMMENVSDDIVTDSNVLHRGEKTYSVVYTVISNHLSITHVY